MVPVIVSLALSLSSPQVDHPSGGTYFDENITANSYRLRVKFDRAPVTNPLACLDATTRWNFIERIPGKVSARKDGVEITYYDEAHYLTVKAVGEAGLQTERARAIGADFIRCLKLNEELPARL